MIPDNTTITNDDTTTSRAKDDGYAVTSVTAAAKRNNKNNNNSVFDDDDVDTYDDNYDREQRLLALLDSTTSRTQTELVVPTTLTTPTLVHNPQQQQLQQQQYETRVLSFRASTYYAKPACLSPLFCARFGWKNVDNDILECTGCQSVLAITLYTKLSNQSYEKLCTAYRENIVSCHTPHCHFRLSKDEFKRMVPTTAMETPINTATTDCSSCDVATTTRSTKVTSTVVPPYMAAVLPEESVRLLGHPKPSTILRGTVKQLIDILLEPSTTTTTAFAWTYPKLVIPTEIRQLVAMDNYSGPAANLFEFSNNDNNNKNKNNNDGNNYNKNDDGDNTVSSLFESVVALAVFGWTPIQRLMADNDDSVPTVTLGCPLCLSVMELTLKKMASQVGEGVRSDGHHNVEDEKDHEDKEMQHMTTTTATKRLRLLSRYCNPLDAHRHYCPYKSGFPNTSMDRPTPVWQIITNRLQKEEKETIIVPAKQQPGLSPVKASMATTITTTFDGNDDDDNDGTRAGTLLDASIDRVRQVLQAGIAPRKAD